MKRFCIFIVLAIILMSIFSGCNNSNINGIPGDTNSDTNIDTDNQNELTDIMICGFSDSVSEIKLDYEYSKWCSDFYIDQNQPIIRIVNLYGSKNIVKYKNSLNSDCSYEVAHTYQDDDRNWYKFNSDGNLIYYFGKTPESNGQVKSQQECEKIASDLISERWDVHIDDYTKTVSYDETRKVYTVSYLKYIGDVKSYDKAEVNVHETGKITRFRFDMFGKISEKDVPEFNWEDIKNKITARLDTETVEARKKYDEVKYENFDYFITMTDPNQYVLFCRVDINCIKYLGDSGDHMIRGAVINFVAPLK